jgi:methionine-rich copper-binding protein CopC
MLQELQAQISYGGTPVSFGSNFRDSQLANQPLVPYLLPALDMEKVRQEDRNTPNNRFAVATEVSISPENAGLWQKLPNGDRLWRVLLHAQTDEVVGMMLLFDKFKLPVGSKLFVYSADQTTVLGAYTSENNHSSEVFSITPIKSREVVMEYYVPVDAQGELKLSVNRIDQAYKNPFFSKNKDKLGKGPNGFGDSGSCNLDVNCTTLSNDWQDEKRGVVRILVVKSSGSGWCTGSMINNTAQDDKAYMLTANHCGSGTTSTQHNQWIFYFNYEITNCSFPNIAPSTSQSITGATLKSNFSNSDFFLMELNQAVPANYNVYYNGWDRSGVNHIGSTCIHHPSGDVKKFSRDTDVTTTTSYLNDAPGSGTTHFRVVWNNGTTEGGSSGSPLFESNGRIVGQLHGGGASCSATTEADWYGKFSVSWSNGLSTWLDPNNSGVTTLNGKNAGGALANFTVSPNGIVYQPDQITFTDASSGTVTSRNWSFGTGASPATATTAGPHNVTYSSAGTKTVTLAVNANASTSTKTINILPTLSIPYTLAQGGNFDSNAEHFAASNIQGTAFERGNSSISGKNGTASGSFAWVLGLTNAEYAHGTHAMIYTPNFNFTNAAGYTFRFKTKIQVETNYDGFIVEYSTNKGNTWTQLGNTTSSDWYNATVGSSVGTGGFASGTKFFSAPISSFETKSFNVGFLSGQANVTFRFVFKSDNSVAGAGVVIDDVEVVSLDSTPPTLVSLNPANNTTNVTITQNLVMTFSENVQKGSGNILIKKVSDNSIFETIAVTSNNVSISNTTVTINPTNDLVGLTDYYVEVPNGAIQDLASNNYAGFTGNATWRFQTASETIPPVVVTFSPTNGSTGVALGANLIITFNEDVKKGTGNMVIRKTSDNTVHETIPITDAKVSIAGKVVTINHANDFASSTGYYVEIANGAIQDMFNNNYAGIVGSNTWAFTSIDNVPPVALTFSPTTGSTNVSVSTNLSIIFTENVKRGTSGAIRIKRTSDNVAITILASSAELSFNNNILTINPTNDLLGLTNYYMEIDNTVISDLANNNYAGITSSSIWTFGTAQETTPPTVVSFNPAHNSLNFPDANNLTITFSENVKKGTGNVVIKKVSDNSIVESIAISSTAITVSNALVTIDPLGELPFNTNLYVEISAGAFQDLADNNFAGFTGANTWRFTTDFSTAIEDTRLSKDISLFPNPTEKWINLAVKEGVRLQDVTLRVYDISGKVVEQITLKELQEKQRFDYGKLSKGKYFLEIQSNKGKAVKAFIKQ